MAISDGGRHEAFWRRMPLPVLDADGVLAMLARRAMFIAGVTLFCAAVSLVYVLLAAPKYVASGRLSVTTDVPVKAIASRGVFDKVIAREKLESDPIFGAKPKGLLTGLLVHAGLIPEDSRVLALHRLERAVTVTRGEGTSIVTVSVATADRDTSACMVNALMDTLVDEASASWTESALPPVLPSNPSLEAAQTRLRDAERNYEAYRQSSGTADTTGPSQIDKQISELTVQAAAAEARANQLRASLTQIQRARDNGDVDAIPGALRSRAFQSLKGRYAAARRIEAELSETLGPRHPDLKSAREDAADARRSLDQAAGDMVKSTIVELERARFSATQFRKRLDDARKEFANADTASARVKELERAVEESRAAYQAALSQSRVREEPPRSDGGAVRILSRAMPPAERSGASPARVLMVSILFGLGLAISLAWLRELMAQRAHASS